MSNAKSVVSIASLAVAVPAALPALAVVGVLVGIGALFSRKSASDTSGEAPVRRIGLFGIRRQAQATSVPVQAVKTAPVSQPTAQPPAAAAIAPVVAAPAAAMRRGGVTADDIRAVLAGGPMKRKDAVAALRNLTGCGQTTAYQAFSADSDFSALTAEDEIGRIGLLA